MTQYLEAPNSNAKLLLLQSLRLHDHLLNPSGHENSKRQLKKIKLKKLKTKEMEKKVPHSSCYISDMHFSP